MHTTDRRTTLKITGVGPQEVAGTGRYSPSPGGWSLALDDGSIVFCPHALCKVEPRKGEPIHLEFAGDKGRDTFRITRIRIGQPPRDYGAIP